MLETIQTLKPQLQSFKEDNMKSVEEQCGINAIILQKMP